MSQPTPGIPNFVSLCVPPSRVMQLPLLLPLCNIFRQIFIGQADDGGFTTCLARSRRAPRSLGRSYTSSWRMAIPHKQVALFHTNRLGNIFLPHAFHPRPAITLAFEKESLLISTCGPRARAGHLSASFKIFQSVCPLEVVKPE